MTFSRHMSKTTLVEKHSIETGTKIVTEAIRHIRTVAALSKTMLHSFDQIFIISRSFNFNIFDHQ